MITFCVPFFFSANLLVILYWLEILGLKKIRTISNLRRLRIPFYVISIYLIAAEVGTDIGRLMQAGQVSLLVSVANIILVSVVICASICVVIYRIQVSQRDGFVINSRLARMRRYMITLAVFCILFVICVIMYGLPVTNGNPWAEPLVLGTCALLLLIVQIQQIFMFMPHRKGHSSSSKAKTTTSGRSEGSMSPKSDGSLSPSTTTSKSPNSSYDDGST